MLDREGELCYVGVSGRLRDRVISYFQKQPEGAKAGRIAQAASCVVWEVAGHEFTARLRELELIRRFLPRFNVQGRPGRRRLGYLFLTPHDAPRLAIERLPYKGARHVWGPLPINRQSRLAVDRLNYLFRLRDCSPRIPVAFTDQGTLFELARTPACPRLSMETCLGPCIAACSRVDYTRQTDRLRSLLDGRDSTPLEDLHGKMQSAADLRRYELAAHYRNLMDDVLPLVGLLEDLRRARQAESFIYRVPGPARRRVLHVIIEGQVHLSTKGTVIPPSATEPQPEPDLDLMRIVRRWFAENPAERANVQPLSTIKAASVQ
jgi:excinuclease ABC subunit C